MKKPNMYSKTFCEDLQQFLPFTHQLYTVIIAVCVFNVLIAVFAVASNVTVVVAIRKSTSLHRPSYILIATLALTDFGVGFAVSPLHICFKVTELKSMDIFCSVGAAYKVTAIFFSGMSFFTVTAISVDRLLAVILGTRYRTVVTIKRIYLILPLLWICSLGFGLIHIINMKAYYATAGLLGFLSLVLTTSNYVKIGCILRKKQNTINCQGGPANHRQVAFHFNLGRYRRSVYSMIYVCVAFLLCYIPYLCVMVVKLFTGPGPVIQGATYITDTIVFMNSALSPALYYWRMPEIRRAVGRLWAHEQSTVVETFATAEFG